MLYHFQGYDDSAFRTLCRENNWRCTVQRRAVFSCLCGNREHPNVETIWKAVRKKNPDISLDSVYRILDAFAEAGLIRRLESDKAIRYDSDTGPHDHFICTECGGITDFKYLEQDQVAWFCRELGSVSGVDLHVRGVCHRCRTQQLEKTNLKQ